MGLKGFKKVAERGRFELPKGSSPSTVFKTVAFNHSAISPKCGCEKESGYYQKRTL